MDIFVDTASGVCDHSNDRVRAVFALTTEITSVERHEGGGGCQRQRMCKQTLFAVDR